MGRQPHGTAHAPLSMPFSSARHTTLLVTVALTLETCVVRFAVMDDRLVLNVTARAATALDPDTAREDVAAATPVDSVTMPADALAARPDAVVAAFDESLATDADMFAVRVAVAEDAVVTAAEMACAA